jgi:GNAT superfamily N-acetyltransferase
VDGAVRIRDARLDDAAGFVTAYELAWDATLSEVAGRRLGELASLEQRTTSFEQGVAKASPDARIWVAERDGAVIGVATCTRKRKTCELGSLYVVPDAWGSGVAQDLMETALDAMLERGAGDAFLWVVESNGRARRFYEREGWLADGESRITELGAREVRYRRSL